MTVTDRIFPFWRAAVGGLIPHAHDCDCPRKAWHGLFTVRRNTFDQLVVAYESHVLPPESGGNDGKKEE